jgi:hypothetical protein
VVRDELEVRAARPDVLERVAALLDDEHYRGRCRSVGRELV